MINLKQIKKLIVKNLSDDLLSKEWLEKKKNEKICHSTFGHCYLAAETAYHLLGGKTKGWKPFYLKYDDESHWFLKHESGIIFDPTSEQFDGIIPYQNAIGKGFLTSAPSKRAQRLMGKIKNSFKP